MKGQVKAFLLAGILTLALAAAAHPAWAAAPQLDAERIGQIIGVKATVTPDGVVRVGWARSDVSVQVDGVPLPPFAGLGSWAGFKATKHGAIVMGDTVLFQDEVAPAMDAAFAAGLEVTALHNHFFYDEPKVYFMHIGGTGEPERLAAGVRAVWDAVKRVRQTTARPAAGFGGPLPKRGMVSPGPLEKILGRKSETQDGMVKVTIGREARMHGTAIDGSMGLTTWAAFSGSDELAIMDGDFIMTAAEVQPVLRKLRQADIHIVALHNHMIGEEPALYFTHFWGKGSPEKLARGIKAALDEQARLSSHEQTR